MNPSRNILFLGVAVTSFASLLAPSHAWVPSTTLTPFLNVHNRLSLRSTGRVYPRPTVAYMKQAGSHLVTYGDLWRDAVPEDDVQTNLQAEVTEAYDEQEAELSVAETLVKPIRQAATAVWERLTYEPSEEEVRANLKAFAKAHGGAVMTPLSEEELEKEVKYCGMFPDLVDALVENEVQMELATEVSSKAQEMAAKKLAKELSKELGLTPPVDSEKTKL
ncbi:hypothetical protein GUITHDRAFT_154286 [Guillardia theta CCMP2712]|uniref:Trigger factor C-terminal domain-containing protein n=1 Tax=Guillardia theta (strain CCMP2712) TaxID=905079 RepID=L1IU66_GUITC|nr:hypothetical protein GUITHDRAFT_154286 [Guillardia theta CCMP2712]EKX39776.1 hypothetical protein GUITHDRAFT_154286 [Guillardia theta CCMP2712]|mmetsp:Transcript_42295/g.133251  ORF Transcript_42295/g.133251 Transcript_42295/m.133251 type:complete len:220 (-) Transcript_42295:990-1649(-)|eukprot:XP_005826756.1 hypothetical protein GUITHDRAFT_154286 [Guillardia theta CCMP2712]